MIFNILIVKETRAGERRVALVPNDVRELIKKGQKVFVEHEAGIGAGFADQDYEQAGASIRYLTEETLESYQNFFEDIHIIVRAKRPLRSREILENKTISAGTIMVGALDPFEKNSSHISEYREAHVIAYSIDQFNLPTDDPMNILAAMSKMAGRLALIDAVEKFQKRVKKVVIIGFGAAGRAAFVEALQQKLCTLVVLSNSDSAKEIENAGAKFLLLDKKEDLIQQQKKVKTVLQDADIVIATARTANQPAPLLVPNDTLLSMQSGAVIVDLALSEGGNVEGSEHDKMLFLGNQVIVTNTSGYPKVMPKEASQLWSSASFHFISLLIEGKNFSFLSG